MVALPNFFENINEALMRLRSTIVLYEEKPYYIYTICGHKPDNIFRVYMTPLDQAKKELPSSCPISHKTLTSYEFGPAMDTWLNQNPTFPILRRMMNSPLFNKFRPFPLGMFNCKGETFYVERQPTRKSEQGLIANMITTSVLGSLHPSPPTPGRPPNLFSEEFEDCILGRYPSPEEALAGLLSHTTLNNAVGFHRRFAFVKGPCETTFLQYKTQIIGVLPHNNLSVLYLDRESRHYLEVVEELNLFKYISN
jgi:hypothetical protein